MTICGVSAGSRKTTASMSTCSPRGWTPWRRLVAGSVRTLGYSPVDGIEIAFEPTDFIQVNARVNEIMVADTLKALDPVAARSGAGALLWGRQPVAAYRARGRRGGCRRGPAGTGESGAGQRLRATVQPM